DRASLDPPVSELLDRGADRQIEEEQRVADLDPVARRELDLACDRLAVHEGSVATLQIRDGPAPVAAPEACVPPRDLAVAGQRDLTGRGAADDQLAADLEPSAGLRSAGCDERGHEAD